MSNFKLLLTKAILYITMHRYFRVLFFQDNILEVGPKIYLLIKFLTYAILPIRMLLLFTLLPRVSENTDFPSLSTKLGNLICQCKSQTGFFVCFFFKLMWNKSLPIV